MMIINYDRNKIFYFQPLYTTRHILLNHIIICTTFAHKSETIFHTPHYEEFGAQLVASILLRRKINKIVRIMRLSRY